MLSFPDIAVSQLIKNLEKISLREVRLNASSSTINTGLIVCVKCVFYGF